MTDRKRFLPWVLVAGDILALVLFALGGQREHELINAGNPLLGVAQTSAEFVLAWLVAAAWSGAFQRDEPASWRAFMRRAANAWLLAAPLATLLRALVLGRGDIPTAFQIVVLLLGGVLLLGWRLLYAILFVVRRADARSAASGGG